MAEIPPHLKAVQEQFRPRMEAQTERMGILQEQALADELASANPVEDMPVEDALAALGGEVATH